MKTVTSLVVIALMGSASAVEPKVIEKQRPDGVTELHVVSEAGQEMATYTVDLKTHHEPATTCTGVIRQWEQYRFGGFVCYNDNQYEGSEISRNKNPGLFNPTNLDVNGWAVAMKQAGMKYAVLTTRHTSGFLLWPSATSLHDVESSPIKSDVVGAFVKSCREQHIAPGLYYCMWGGKQFLPQKNARAIILAQLAELATQYGEIPYFWIDMFRWAPADLSPQEVYDAIKNLQPNAVVIMNQHVQDGSKIAYFPSDVLNGEIFLPPATGHNSFRTVQGKQYYLPFEFEPVSQRRDGVPGTVTPAGRVGAWFTYGTGKNFKPSKSFPAQDMFDWIKSAYDRGTANVLLSLAPDHNGSMRPDDVKQLVELGTMLRKADLLDAPSSSEYKHKKE